MLKTYLLVHHYLFKYIISFIVNCCLTIPVVLIWLVVGTYSKTSKQLWCSTLNVISAEAVREDEKVCVRWTVSRFVWNLLTYMGVFGLVQTRGFCLEGVIRPLDLCVPLLLLLKGKVITSCFFNTCLPLGVGVKNVKGIKGVKWRILRSI